MKNICVIGHANNISVTDETKKLANIVTNWILKNNFRATTGGCIGIPELVANAVSERKGHVLAYSPAIDVLEHITEYGFAENKNIEMRYLKGSTASKNARFLIRSIDLVEEADLVVCFNGTWGTLSEIVFAVMCGKQILFLNVNKNNETLKKVYELMEGINLTDWGNKFVEVTSEEQLQQELEKFEKTNEI